ncbi:TraX family protein [Paenibacillus sp. GCM10012303]|uniref:TraX family protein n=1 Tax=Paenibacillus sp. GCM10012303 TaxID=3317340 RepID=UPI00360669BC
MLQFIAMITMLVDHVGIVFYPDIAAFRVIGRIAFPLYGWFLVQGYLHTGNLKRYAFRLLGLAVLSQLPFTLSLQLWQLNVIFTLLLALGVLYTLDSGAKGIFKLLLVGGAVGIALWVPMSYGLYGVMIALLFRYFRQWQLVHYHFLLDAAHVLVYGFGYAIQLFSVFGTFLIVCAQELNSRVQLNKWIYRGFYPGHLAVLYGLRLWIGT